MGLFMELGEPPPAQAEFEVRPNEMRTRSMPPDECEHNGNEPVFLERARERVLR